MIIAPTHYFRFTPEDKHHHAYEFAMQSEYLVKPENFGFGFFPILIAGLEDEDFIRLKLYCFSDAIVGEICTFIPEEGKELPEELVKRNEAAFERTKKFMESLKDAGFAKEIPVLEEGKSPIMQDL